MCVKSDENDPKAVKRVNKIGNTVYEIFHDAFVGKLTGIRTKESAEYGKSWLFDFVDVPTGEKYTLQLSYSNSYATALLKMLPNIDLSREFKISPSSKIVEGKTQSSLFVNQDGKPVRHAFTKENPNGMPNMEKITVKGKETWDDSKRLAFLEHVVNTQIVPKLDNSTPVQSNATNPEVTSNVTNGRDFGDDQTSAAEPNPDDIPF